MKRFTQFCFRGLLLAALFGAMTSGAKERWTAPEQAAQQHNPLAQNKEAITRGKAIYADRCMDCHGKNGRGDGPGAVDLEIQPPNFSHAQVKEQSDGALFWKISQGRKPMPGYGRKLSEEERWAVVAYLRSLAGR